MTGYVLFVLRVYLAASTVPYLHYVSVHAMVHTLRRVNPHGSYGGHSVTLQLLLLSSLPMPKRWAWFMSVTALHPLPNSTGPYLAVLPHPPSCSSNPLSGTAAILYLSSRRQPTLPPTSPTSAPSCFSLSNHVRHSHL